MSIDYLPTPEEIKKACSEIREKWPEEEFFKRANKKKDQYVVPICEVTPAYNEFEAESNVYRR